MLAKQKKPARNLQQALQYAKECFGIQEERKAANTHATPRTHLLEEDWIVVIQEQIAAQPEHISEVVEPEIMGMYDCEQGKPCDPLQYYAKLGDVESYIIGWKAAKELAQYRGELADEEFIRMGGA